MIRRYGTVLALALAGAGCFEAGSGNDEIAETGTGSETTSEGESSSSTTTSESTSEESTSEESTTTEESTESESTSEESTTGEPDPVCGNGIVEDGEVCDDGPMPELMPGACVPDCSAQIQVKRVKLGAGLASSDFGNNPVAFADSTCEPGYKAMFAYGNLRVATTVAWETVNPVDWPIQPYTAYLNVGDKLIWVTDETRLLTVRDGQKQNPANPLYTCNPFCLARYMVSGMNDDGTNLLSNTCNGWTSTTNTDQFAVGEFGAFEAQTDVTACSDTFPDIPFYNFLCVEQ